MLSITTCQPEVGSSGGVWSDLWRIPLASLCRVRGMQFGREEARAETGTAIQAVEEA